MLKKTVGISKLALTLMRWGFFVADFDLHKFLLIFFVLYFV